MEKTGNETGRKRLVVKIPLKENTASDKRLLRFAFTYCTQM